MTIVWFRDRGKAHIGKYEFDITSDVRNELNGRRKLHDPKEVRRAIVNGQWGPPYMPRPFPTGLWEIIAAEESDDPEFAPVKLKTTATQKVETWSLDLKGGYNKPTGKYVLDEGYHLHFSRISKTTLGCGRVGTDNDTQILSLTNLYKEAIMRGDRVWLMVEA